MPTLNWIGKDKVVNHHLDVPFYTLEHQYGFRASDENDKSETRSGNMIIHGDNLVALKALLPEFEGRVNCAYFDPPYNTGEEKWVYNDNLLADVENGRIGLPDLQLPFVWADAKVRNFFDSMMKGFPIGYVM